MPALRDRPKALLRQQKIYIQVSDDEARAIRMVQADSGAKQVGNFCRDILMRTIEQRFEELRRRGVGQAATAGGR